jgi:hypothetical protein
MNASTKVMMESVSGAANSIFNNIAPADVVEQPYPYLYKDQLLRPDLFQRLKAEFPSDKLFDGRPTLIGSRTGRDFFKGDPEFNGFLAGSPAWKEFYDYINSRDFLDLTLQLFGPYFQKFGCAVNADKAKQVEYTEDRLSLWWRSKKALYLGMGRKANPNNLFTRFDIEQSGAGYDKPVHCDWPSRLISMIVYFNDADEIGMEGGDLRIHEALEPKAPRDYNRHPKADQTRIIKTLRPRENMGLLFLCSNNSYHSVSAIKSVRDYRRFIYLNISSTAENIW